MLTPNDDDLPSWVELGGLVGGVLFALAMMAICLLSLQ